MEKIAVIVGGNNSEREVSFRSGSQVAKTLEILGYEVQTFDVPTDLEKFLLSYREFSFAFVIIHGKDGEDGKIPALLELLEVPFQGSPSIAHAIAIQKDKTKQIWRDKNLPLGKDSIETFYDKTLEEADKIIQQFWGYPCVIKSLQEGSTRGVFIIHDKRELSAQYEQILAYHNLLLVEEYLDGDEYTVGVLEMPDGTVQALPPVWIIPPEGKEFDYENKYNGATQEICPADIRAPLLEKMLKIAVEAHHAVGARGYSRVDFICQGDDPYLLEINTIPGFTAQSLFPKEARAYGISFEELLKILMKTGKKIALQQKNSLPIL